MKTIRFWVVILVLIGISVIPSQTFGATKVPAKIVKTPTKPALTTAKKVVAKKVVAVTKKPIKKALKKTVKPTSKLISNPPLIDPNNPPGGPLQ